MPATVRYLTTLCSECVLRIRAGDTFDDPEFPPFPYVELSMLSTHATFAHNSLRGKLRRLRAALRDEPEPWLEFYSREELQEFVDALTEAGEAAFGS